MTVDTFPIVQDDNRFDNCQYSISNSDGPEITSLPEEVVREEGETLQQTCISEGNPAAHSYAWKRVDHPSFLQVHVVSNMYVWIVGH